jgi:hypothetical protein
VDGNIGCRDVLGVLGVLGVERVSPWSGLPGAVTEYAPAGLPRAGGEPGPSYSTNPVAIR